ncbi:MAG: hypothetical protein IKF91_04190 [Bacilli bacterium]|nr:hypothetical protein [Bacilli bacterium]
MKINKKLLMKVKNIRPQTTSAEELYNLSLFTNAYIDRPTKENKETLEIYCSLIESQIELDKLEEKTKKYVK